MSPAPVRPANSTGFRDATDTVRVSIGEGGTGYAGAGVPLDALRLGPFHPFKWGVYEPVTLQMKNDRVLFNFVLWDSSGKPPIEVHDNEFTVRNSQWDKNRSDNELEVINSEGTVVFQMIRKSPTDILLTGIFPLPAGTFLIAGHNGAIQTNQILPKYLPSKIFKYPSWQYPGVHADEQ
jgi:hypothetical protein